MHRATSSSLEVKLKSIDIGEVARRSGLPASTLRYYEERGLITSAGRRGLRRVFDPVVLERLALVGLGCAAGFSLEEIACMFAANGEPRRAPPSGHGARAAHIRGAARHTSAPIKSQTLEGAALKD